MAVGGMVALLTGLCTVAAMAPAIQDHLRYNQVRGYDQTRGYYDLFFILGPVIGGIPMAIGGAIAILGIAMIRRPGRGLSGPSSEDRERLFRKTQTLAAGVLLVGIGGPILWLSSFLILAYVSSRSGRDISELAFGLGAGALGVLLTWFGLARIWRGVRRGPVEDKVIRP